MSPSTGEEGGKGAQQSSSRQVITPEYFRFPGELSHRPKDQLARVVAVKELKIPSSSKRYIHIYELRTTVRLGGPIGGHVGALGGTFKEYTRTLVLGLYMYLYLCMIIYTSSYLQI